MRCPICGASYDAPDSFCRNCGRRLGKPPQACKTAPIIDSVPVPVQIRNHRFTAAMKAASLSIILLALLIIVLMQSFPNLLNGTGFGLVDLGVKWSEKDYNSIIEKCGVLTDAPPAGTDKSRYKNEYTGLKDIEWSLTESEISALLGSGSKPGYWPISSVQIKLHPDNVVEASCIIDPVKLLTYPVIKNNLPKEINNYVSNITMQIPVYAKAQISITGPKQADVVLQSLSASGFTVPDIALGEQANQMLESIINDILEEAGPVCIAAFSTSEGQLKMSGTWFTELKRIAIE